MVKSLHVKWALVSLTSRKGLVPCLRQSIHLNNADHILRINFLANTFSEFEPDFALFFSTKSVELGKYVIESCSYNMVFDESALC